MLQKQNQPHFSGKKLWKKFCQNISGLEALEVMPWGGKKTSSYSWGAFVDNDKTCSHKGGLSSMYMHYHFPAGI